MDAREIVILLDCYYKHDWDKIYTAIRERDTELLYNSAKIALAEIEKFRILHEGYKFLYLGDDDYPRDIFEKSKPPFVIYYKCDIKEIPEKFAKISYKPEEGCFID